MGDRGDMQVNPLLAFEAHLSHKHAPRTVVTYVRISKMFLEHVKTTTPSPERVDVFLSRPRASGRPPSIATRNQELGALKALAAFFVARGVWTHDPTADLSMRKVSEHEPTVLTIAELRRLFEVAGQEGEPVARARGIAALALLSQAGLRVHELVALDCGQLALEARLLLGVRGKGDTRFDCPLNLPTVELLHRWLRVRPGLASPGETALFVSSRGTRASVRLIQRYIADLGKKLGSKKPLHPHALRHTCGTALLTLGVDLDTCSKVLRHANITTTQRYLHLASERREVAVGKLAVTVPLEALPEALPVGYRPEDPPANDIIQGKNDLDVQDPLCDMTTPPAIRPDVDLPHRRELRHAIRFREDPSSARLGERALLGLGRRQRLQERRRRGDQNLLRGLLRRQRVRQRPEVPHTLKQSQQESVPA